MYYESDSEDDALFEMQLQEIQNVEDLQKIHGVHKRAVEEEEEETQPNKRLHTEANVSVYFMRCDITNSHLSMKGTKLELI